MERAAIALRDYLRQHVRGGRIDLVCHCLGGLVARVYLQQLGESSTRGPGRDAVGLALRGAGNRQVVEDLQGSRAA